MAKAKTNADIAPPDTPPKNEEKAISPAHPSVGRIVHYFPHKDVKSMKGQPYPAIITHIFSADCVNLNVIADGSFPTPACEGPKTSIRLKSNEQQHDCWDWPARA